MFLALFTLCSTSIARDLYVPSQYPTIQRAVNHAFDGDTVIVAPGTYTGPGNRDIDFLGKPFTVRSQNGPNDCIIDCNSYDGFLFHNGEDARSVLMGFTIINAYSGISGGIMSDPTITDCVIMSGRDRHGGGIYCYGGPTITNCTISDNNGFGIYCRYGRPKITNCTISGNSNIGIFCKGGTITNCIISGNTTNDGGGGIYCDDYSVPMISNCIITGNTNTTGRFEKGGGGIYCGRYSSPIIINCTITGNSASLRHGGGIYCCRYSSLTISDCTISDNIAGDKAGGIFCEPYSSLTINNCKITGNSAYSDGGGIWSENSSIKIKNCTISGSSAGGSGGGLFLNGSAFITDSIVWGNTDSSGSGQTAQLYGGTPTVWFSCIQDDNPGDGNVPFGEDRGNIDYDPCFVSPGFWDANGLWHNGDYHLLPNSPCIETGSPSFTYRLGDVDIDGQPRLMGRRVDMGADEFELSVIVVTKPKGGEVWTAGSAHEIKWDSFSTTGTVDIYYSANNGADWIKIANAPDTGAFTWDIPVSKNPRLCQKPPFNSSQCLISVEPNVPDPNFIGVKSGLFTIQPFRSLPPVPYQPQCPHIKFGPKYGCVKWKFQTGGPVTAGVAVGFNNRIHVPCEDGKLYTLSSNGQLLWAYNTGSPLVVTPAVDRNGTVYAGTENGKLYAIDRTGRLLWTHTTDGPVYSSPVISTDALMCQPFAGFSCPHWKKRFPPWHHWNLQQNVQIFVGSVDGALYALAQDGSELWDFETDGISPVTTGSIFASPAIDPNGSLYIAGLYDPNLYAVDSNSVSEKWNCSFADPCDWKGQPWPFTSSVIADNGIIYQALLYDPNLYAIDPNNGSIIWATNLADPCSGWFEPYFPFPSHPEIARYHISGSAWSKPVLAPDGTIYVSLNDPYLRAVDPNGTIKWVTKLGTIGGFTLTVGGDGLIYAACDDGILYVLGPNGQQVSQFEGDGALSFPTITAGRTIIVSDANSAVWAISPYNCWGKPFDLHKLEDLNGDGSIDSADLALLTADWLDCTDTGPPCNYNGARIYLKGDLNKDLYVDLADYNILANRWLNKE